MSAPASAPSGSEIVTQGLVKTFGTRTVVDGVSLLLDDAGEYERMSVAHNPYGDGRASERIAQALRIWLPH